MGTQYANTIIPTILESSGPRGMTNDLDPTVISMIIGKLDTTEENLNRRLDATESALNRRLDAQDTQLKDIKAQTTLTNGRVTVLETARAHTQGVMSAYRWVPTALSALFSAGLTILTLALSGSIH